jgi:fructosamine-3-kinase
VSATAAIEVALAATGAPAAVTCSTPLSGGCIHRVLRVETGDGDRVVAKLGDADAAGVFAEEAAGLAALGATGTVRVPAVIGHGVFAGSAVLLLQHLETAPATNDGWRSFGDALAALHATDAGRRYGFSTDNHLGATAQPNAWTDDWIEFNATHRIGWQIELARRGGRLSGAEERRLERVRLDLARHLPRAPRPSLLHGDLWSGNALPTRDEDGTEVIAVIDPACSVGDGWADIAMMQLFGGFAPVCFESYARAVDDHDRVEQRIAVYQLYHLLNHLNLFGRGYAGQVMGVVGRLEGA